MLCSERECYFKSLVHKKHWSKFVDVQILTLEARVESKSKQSREKISLSQAEAYLGWRYFGPKYFGSSYTWLQLQNSMFQEIIFTPFTNPVFFTPNHFIFSCFLIFELGSEGEGGGKNTFHIPPKSRIYFLKNCERGMRKLQRNLLLKNALHVLFGRV